MKVLRFVFSGSFMGILLFIFAFSIGYATFIENDYDATTARLAVYNARWFEYLLLLMVINFSGMIFTRKLYQKEKLNVLLIHIALVIIIIGAALTRYIGTEGTMHIRNGATSNSFTSAETYLLLQSGDNTVVKEVMLSARSKSPSTHTLNLNGQQVDFEITQYLPNAVQKITRTQVGVKNATSILKLIVRGEEHTHTINLKKGETINIHELGISYGDTSSLRNVHIVEGEDGLQLRLPLNFKATDATPGKRTHSQFVPLRQLSQYRFTGMTLILVEHFESALMKYAPAESDEQGDRIILAKINGQEMILKLNEPGHIDLGNLLVEARIGSVKIDLPFSLHLTSFELDRYPGSNSPSSFASEIVLIDKSEDLVKPYRIFMNNILSYKGYRFYQSSYDPDEQGTVLSVNQDYWGTRVTYTGYFLLFGSLILSFFTKKTRFARLLKKFDHVRMKRNSLTAMILIFLMSSHNTSFSQVKDSLAVVDQEHAMNFGQLQLQNPQGRMMPVNTMSSEFLIKIHKKDSYENLTSDQVLLEMLVHPVQWMKKPMIKIGDDELKNLLEINDDYARFIDFFTQQGVYKISQQVNEAYMRRPAMRTRLDKELIYVDERVNVFTMAIEGALLRIFPLPHQQNNTWGSPAQFEEIVPMMGMDSLFTSYKEELVTAKRTGNYERAEAVLQRIKDYQLDAGKAVVLSDTKIDLEILYNETDIFKRLFPFYLTLGILLTGIFFIQVLKPNIRVKTINRILAFILFFSFFLQTLGLILRWYISGHAPWSNGYESMLYISWVTVFAGLLFMNKSSMALAVSTLLAGITLLTAHMSWLNPEITNLVPVLKSYWLTIHVATITASYGFLGMAAMLGFMNLCIMIFRNRESRDRINLVLKELSIIIELALSVGLVLLIIGNFLGGIWANESWGRYWGWDPKETWTLVTIIAYSFILHMRLIPGLRSMFSFNFSSLIAFSTILMTYFGVNFYLSGLHSYAQGDPVPIPTFVYYLLAIIAIVSGLAALNNYRLNPVRTKHD